MLSVCSANPRLPPTRFLPLPFRIGSSGALFAEALTNLGLTAASRREPASKAVSISASAYRPPTHWARQAGASNEFAKYCVSRETLPSRNSMILTVKARLPP
jgi:hypothetical protein